MGDEYRRFQAVDDPALSKVLAYDCTGMQSTTFTFIVSCVESESEV